VALSRRPRKAAGTEAAQKKAQAKVRIVIVWLLALVLLVANIVAFFSATPSFYLIMESADDIWTGAGITGLPKSTWDTVYAVMSYSWIWVMVIDALVIIMWAYMHSFKRDSESYAVTGGAQY